MSINKLKTIFTSLSSSHIWTVQLLNISQSDNAETIYTAKEIQLAPADTLWKLVATISQKYTKPTNGIIASFLGVQEYDASAVDKIVYRMPCDSELISAECTALLNASARPNSDANPLEMNYQAYILRGEVTINDISHSVKLISIQNPITILRHKFSLQGNSFKEIDNKVLSLKETFDVVIWDDTVYFLTLNGEKLFNMERSYKKVCVSKIQDIQDADIVTDSDAFRAAASSGHNPRKFVTYNSRHLDELKNGNTRERMARKFNIATVGDRFDTSVPDTTDKIIKLLCNRGMVDPFDENPMEVAGSKKWV